MHFFKKDIHLITNIYIEFYYLTVVKIVMTQNKITKQNKIPHSLITGLKHGNHSTDKKPWS